MPQGRKEAPNIIFSLYAKCMVCKNRIRDRHTHIHTLPLLVRSTAHSTKGGFPGGFAPPVPVYVFPFDCVTCVALHHLPCSTTWCYARVFLGGASEWHRRSMASRLEVLPPAGCMVHPFRGQFLRIASIAIACGWMVEMGHPGMGHRTTSGEGCGATQETETRHRHPSRLAVVLLRNRAWGRVMVLLVAIV